MTTEQEFDKFWEAYPHKVSKFAARRAFDKVSKNVNIDDILHGVKNYITSKPPHHDYAHPATWLNGGRWLDEPAPAAIQDKLPASVQAIKDQSHLDRVEKQLAALRSQMPFSPPNPAKQKLFNDLKAEKTVLMQRLDFKV